MARRALIIATSTYEDSGLRRLRSPAVDAQKLVTVLEDPQIGDFEIRVLTDSPEARLRREILRFFAGAELDDLLLLHFSCHGVKDDRGELYFAATDTELETLAASAVPAEFVNRQIGDSRSRQVILLLDCCYSGAFAPGLGRKAGDAVEIGERFDGKGRAILTASTSMEYSFEGGSLTDEKGEPSVFTQALIEGLRSGDADRDGDGRISIDELHEYIRARVRERTSKQNPQKWTYGTEGQLIIARSRRRAGTGAGTGTGQPMSLVAPAPVKLPLSAAVDLDEPGTARREMPAGREAAISRVEILDGKLSYARSVMRATLVDGTPQSPGRLFDRDFTLHRALESRIEMLRAKLEQLAAEAAGAPLDRLWRDVEHLTNEVQETAGLCFEATRS